MPALPPRLPVADWFRRLGLLFASTFGLFYFSYKYLLPPLGIGDSDYYYPIFRAPLDFAAGRSPFVLRQVGAVLTWLVWKAHLFYPAEIAYVDPHYDQHVFFAALFVNWVCLVFAAFIAGLLVEELLGRRDFLLATLAAFLCVLSFHTQTAVLTDIAEGPAWLLTALALLFVFRRAWPGLLLVLALATFQREMILLALGFLAALELLPWRRANRFAQLTLGVSVLCFAVYLVLRRKLGGWDFQSHPTSLLNGLLRSQYDRDLLFQGFLSQNVVLIALVSFFAARSRPPAARYWMPKLLAAFVFLVLVSLGSFEGNNTGRLAGILTPAFAALAAVCLFSSRDTPAPPPAADDPPGTNRLAYAFLALSLLLVPTIALYKHGHPRPPKKPRLQQFVIADPHSSP